MEKEERPDSQFLPPAWQGGNESVCRASHPGAPNSVLEKQRPPGVEHLPLEAKLVEVRPRRGTVQNGPARPRPPTANLLVGFLGRWCARVFPERRDARLVSEYERGRVKSTRVDSLNGLGLMRTRGAAAAELPGMLAAVDSTTTSCWSTSTPIIVRTMPDGHLISSVSTCVAAANPK